MLKRHTKRPQYRHGVHLSRSEVSHWSTAMYGSPPNGHISTWVQEDGRGSLDMGASPPKPYALITLSTPGGKAPDGIHGGARRIDIGLSLSGLEDLIDDLIDTRDKLAAKVKP